MTELTQYINEHLKKEYTLVETLSENAVSTALRYKHNESGREIKLIKTLDRYDCVYRMLNNIDFGGKLAQIYIVSSDDDALYIVEEYVKGEPATRLIGKEDNLNEVASCALDICTALQILHSKNIIHRDVKPSNIILKDDGGTCLIDLSIAKCINGDSKTDTRNLGTVGFAAPEQFGITQSRPETDIFALGVTMNIMLTGEHPTIYIPKGKIGKIIKKCTSLEINKRYSSIDELKSDLIKIRK